MRNLIKKNNILYRIMSLLIIFTFILGSTISVSAKPTSNNVDYTEDKEIVLDFLTDNEFTGNIEDGPIELYNLDNKVNYLCFSLENGGYVIINILNKSIPEYSLTNRNKFIDKSIKNYYGGPLTYLIKENNNFVDLKTKQIVTNIQELRDNIRLKEQKIQQKPNKNRVKRSTTRYENSLPFDIPNFDYNPDGRCGATASAMFLRYFDEHLDGRYLPDRLHDADQIELIDEIVKFVPTSATPSQLKNGLERFLRQNGVNDGIRYSGIQMSRVKERIDNGRPFILGLFKSDGNKYGNHWVIASGYKFTRLTPSGNDDPQFIIINDGWGETGVHINIVYTDYMVW